MLNLCYRAATAVAMALLIGSVTVPSYAQTKQRFDLEPQPLAKALNALASQAGINIYFNPPDVEGKQAPELKTDATADDALGMLLKGTELKAVYVDKQTVRVVAKGNIADSGGNAMKLAQHDSQNNRELANATATAENETNTQGIGKVEAGQSTDSPGNNIQEIVVTAQKREERLQDVPISVFVLGGEDLDKSTLPDLNGELRRVPGVSLGGQCCAGETTIAVRGVPSNGTAGGSSTTAFYLDWMPLSFASLAIGPNLNVYDLDRLEVLRGPQGTLYGASALNGVVRVLTNDADLNEFELKTRTTASATRGGSESYRGDLAINVPILENKLAARVALGYEDQGGWIDKPNFRKDSNDGRMRNMRLKVNAQPSEQLSVGLVAWLSKEDFNGFPISDKDGARYSLMDEPMVRDFDAYGLKIAYDFSRFSLASMTSHLDHFWDILLDFRSTSTAGSTAGGAPAFLDITYGLKTFAQEVLLTSRNEGQWRWSAGAIYRDSEDRRNIALAVLPYPSRDTYFSESYAVFGELTRLFLDGRWELTAGLRHFEDDVLIRESARLGVGPVQLVRSSDKFHATTPRLAVSWHPTEHMTAYASYSQGFRSGYLQTPAVIQLNSAPPALPDRLMSYEVGVKGSLFDGRLGYETALYYIDWQDAQVPKVDDRSGTYAAIFNSESVSGIGVDFGIVAKPLDRLELSLSTSWNDLKLDSDLTSGGVPLYLKGERMPNSVDYSGIVSANYIVPLGGNGFEGRFSASYNIASKLHAGRAAPGLDRAPTEGQSFARTSLSIRAPQRWTVTLFADNLLNDQSLIAQVNDFWAARQRPRTVGVQLEYLYAH